MELPSISKDPNVFFVSAPNLIKLCQSSSHFSPSAVSSGLTGWFSVQVLLTPCPISALG